VTDLPHCWDTQYSVASLCEYFSSRSPTSCLSETHVFMNPSWFLPDHHRKPPVQQPNPRHADCLRDVCSPTGTYCGFSNRIGILIDIVYVRSNLPNADNTASPVESTKSRSLIRTLRFRTTKIRWQESASFKPILTYSCILVMWSTAQDSLIIFSIIFFQIVLFAFKILGLNIKL